MISARVPILIGGYALHGAVYTITATGASTWTCPNGVRRISAECWAAGGGGDGVNNDANSGMGGGGGAYSKTNVIPVQPGQPYTATVGLGEPGGPASGAWPASNGDSTATDSSFLSTSTVLAKGGAGGAVSGAGGAGGAAASGVGDTKYSGGNGARDTVNGGGGGGGAGSGGAGANAVTNAGGAAGAGSGGGAGGTGVTLQSPGTVGAVYGGGGASAGPVTSAIVGGAGANGKIILTSL